MERLKELLDNQTWPRAYKFKFVVKAHLVEMAKTELFEGLEVDERVSAKGSYVSLTCEQVLRNSDEVLRVYEKAQNIEGIISL